MDDNQDMPRTPNRLLAALPEEERDQLWAAGALEYLELRQSLYEPRSPISDVYFPMGGVVSMVTIMESGAIMEVATVGNEGMAGLPVFLGADASPLAVFSQVPGSALRLPAQALREIAVPPTRLHQLLHRYTQALLVLTAQSVACNRLHPIQERCARWLLMTADRVDGVRFPLTHEFLSQMLGVRRASVSEVAAQLQEAGLIEYQRGVITILDRPGLEAAACECYAIIHDEFERMLT